MTKHIQKAVSAAAILVGCVSCSDVVQQSHAPLLLNVASLQAAPTGGFGANNLGNVLFSDVQVLVTAPAPCAVTSPCPTIYSDRGQAVISSAMKDVGVSPTSNNQVTINRYHVQFQRADGRNLEGVDVPRSFDGAVTATIPPNGSQAVPFELVRHVAKEESPLAQLVSSTNFISTIAIVTFYGTDAVGNVVSATGQISVNFGNFGDQ
jgi:hypothetical protein